MITSLTLACALLTKPAWFDDELAGYVLVYDLKHGAIRVEDTEKGYRLQRDIECDGADVNLVLEPVSHAPLDEGKVVHDSLRNLSTGKGIAIGWTKSQVEKKLGKPSRRGKDSDVDSIEYVWHAGKHDFTDTYEFTKGKLNRIMFARSAADDTIAAY